MSRLDGVDRTVLGHLRPMFPQLGVAVLETSILHPSNREGVFDEFLLLQRCIDDLLELRTHTMPPEIPPEIPPEDPAPVAQWQDEAYQDEQDLGNLSDAQCKEFGIVHGYNKQNLGSNGNFKPLDNRSAVDERNVGIGCAPSVGNNSVACSSRNVGYTATNDGCYSNYNTPQVPNLYGNQNTNTSVMNSIRPSAGGSSNYSMPHAVFHTRGGPPIINYSMPRPVFHTRGGSSVPPDRSSALHHGTIVVGDDSYCVEPRDGYGSPVTYRFGLGTHNPGSNHDVGMHTGVHRYRGDHDAGPIQMNNVAIGPQPPWQQPEQQQPIQQQQQPMQQQQQPMQQQQQPIQQHQQPIQQHQQPMQQQQHPQQQQQSPAQPKQVHNPLNAATPRQFEDHHKPRTPVRLDERASQRLTQQQSPAVRAGNQQDIVIAASSSSASATVTGTADPVDNLPSGSVPDGSATQCWRPARPEYKASRRSRPGLYSSADMHTGDTDDEDTETDEGDEDDELPTIGSVKTKQRAIPKEVLKQRARKLSAPAAGLPKLTANQERFQMDINKNIQKNLDKIESSVKLIQNAIFPAVRNPNIGPAGDVATPGGRGMKRAHSATATATVTLAEDQDVIVEDVYRPEVIDLVVTPLPRPILPKVTFVDDPPPPMGPLTPQRRAPPPPQAPQTPPRQVPPPPPAPKKKTAEDVLEERTERVCMLFPKAEPTFVKQQLRFAVHDDPETVVCNYLLEHPGHPKRPSGKTPAATNDTTVVNGGGDAASLIQSTIMSPQAPSIDYYKDYNKVNPPSDYIDQTITLLKAEFLKVSVGDIRSVCNAFSYHYAPTRKFFIDVFRENGYTLNETHKVIGSQGIKVLMSNIDLPFTSHLKTLPVKSDSVPVRFKETGIKILKCGRARPTLSPPCSQLLDELNFIIRLNNAETETHDAEMAQTLNEEQYEEEGQAIECGCCYGDCPFDKMVQCYEGHLFCQSCLQCYVKEAVYGQGKSKLECLSDGCEAGFPKSELLRAVPSTVIDKFEEKEQEQSLNLADMSDLVRCPHCDYAAVLDPSIKVFKCHNKECGKETCRHCKEDWEEHFGIPCKEMEKKDETKLRLQFEEKMTMAKIRTCARCKAGFTKSDGCNKMSCPCGAKMCYICRKPNIDYNHFCNHARDPGKKCTKCTNCSLWTNPEEDDERAVLEIRKEAQQARQAQGFADDKLIGAPDEAEPKAKKARKN